jgi:hypothetical protein
MMVATGRLLKEVALGCGVAVVTSAFTLAASAQRDVPERQPLGHLWENVPHCRVLLEWQHGVSGHARPRKVSITSTTLCQEEVLDGEAVLVTISGKGVEPCGP